MSAARRRHRSRSISIDVEVELDNFETKDLIAELEDRGEEMPGTLRNELLEIRAELMAGRLADAMSLLEKLIWPKWRTVQQCESDFAKTKTTGAIPS